MAIPGITQRTQEQVIRRARELERLAARAGGEGRTELAAAVRAVAGDLGRIGGDYRLWPAYRYRVKSDVDLSTQGAKGARDNAEG